MAIGFLRRTARVVVVSDTSNFKTLTMPRFSCKYTYDGYELYKTHDKYVALTLAKFYDGGCGHFVISAHFLISAYFLSTKSDRRMRLLTRVYGTQGV